MNKLSISTLRRVALGIAIVGTGTGYCLRRSMQTKLSESMSYKEALQCLRSNANAMEVLGDPVLASSIDICDHKCFGREGNLTWHTVPLKGQKRAGKLHYWVTITDPKNEEFRVSRVELEVHGSKIKILLKDNPVDPQMVEIEAA